MTGEILFSVLAGAMALSWGFMGVVWLHTLIVDGFRGYSGTPLDELKEAMADVRTTTKD